MKVRYVRALPLSIMFSRHSIDYFPQPLFSKFLLSLMCLFRYSFRKLCELFVCLDVTNRVKISSEVWGCIIRKENTLVGGRARETRTRGKQCTYFVDIVKWKFVEIMWNGNLMEQDNFIDVFLARHVSGTCVRCVRCEWCTAPSAPYTRPTQRLSRPPSIQKLGTENHTLQLNN